MVIGTSTVNMAASGERVTKVKQSNQALSRNLNTGQLSYMENSFESTFTSTYSSEDGEFIDKQPRNDSDLKTNNYIAPTLTKRQEDSVSKLLAQLRNFLLEFRNRLTIMIGRRGNHANDRNHMINNYLNAKNTIDLTSGSSQTANIWSVTNYTEYTYYESETLNFLTKGNVVTADGKMLEFNMEIAMSREYVETSQMLTHDIKVILTDPLVINLESEPVGVSDQKWKFDIDADGVIDSISMLSKGSGFLVFDKNEDGIINNGLELFGAKTGHGFAELANYDEDGNGWIDENDSIYSKLSVWTKNDSGDDKMLSLKEANVGAIYLTSMITNYALKSSDDNKQNAQIRRSGMYITEDGLVGSIQQLDMVKEPVN